jgi:hypothetical protein
VTSSSYACCAGYINIIHQFIISSFSLADCFYKRKLECAHGEHQAELNSCYFLLELDRDRLFDFRPSPDRRRERDLDLLRWRESDLDLLQPFEGEFDGFLMRSRLFDRLLKNNDTLRVNYNNANDISFSIHSVLHIPN